MCDRSIVDEKYDEEKVKKMSAAIKTLLECVGEDPNRNGMFESSRIALDLSNGNDDL
jgi:GTP cyclohydrolase I